MFKKKNYKLLIGILVGIIISSGIVYANSYKNTADNIEYDNSNSGLYSDNVQDAIEELYERKDCPLNHACIKYKNTLELGDYVYYKPLVESYDTDTSKTNYTLVQTIYPSELTLWRVLFINDDGTIDLVSEDVSSTSVNFKGQLGYQNLVGYLNELASQYETEGITAGSRHFGYNGQTEYITDTSKFTNPAPWTCSTVGSCSPAPVESQGGGDKLYERDYNQAQSILKTVVAYKVGTTVPSFYWISNRNYNYSSESDFSWDGHYVYTSGGTVRSSLYYFNGVKFYEYSRSSSLRPIVTLESGLEYEGIGIKDSPMRIITS